MKTPRLAAILFRSKEPAKFSITGAQILIRSKIIIIFAQVERCKNHSVEISPSPIFEKGTWIVPSLLAASIHSRVVSPTVGITARTARFHGNPWQKSGTSVTVGITAG